MKKLKFQLFVIAIGASVLSLLICTVIFSQYLVFLNEQQRSNQAKALMQAVNSTDSLLGTVESSIMSFSYNSAVQELLRSPAISSSTLKNYDAVKTNATMLLNNEDSIAGIVLIGREKVYFSFGIEKEYIYINTIRKMLTDSPPKKGFFQGELDNICVDNSSYFSYTLPIYSAAQKSGVELGQHLGTCIVFCKKSALTSILDSLTIENMSIDLFSETDKLMLSSRMLDAETRKPTTSVTHQLSSGWYFVQETFSISPLAVFSAVFTTALFLIIFVIIALSLLLRENFTRPISQINEGLLRISEHPLDQNQLTINCSNELNTIANSINNLLEHVHNMHNEQVEKDKYFLRVQLSMSQLQLALLQSQINPHFLYNTLAVIRGIALKNNVQVIADIVTNMVSLYRYSIKGGLYARLQDEIKVVNHYLNIINIRIDNIYKTTITVPDDLLDLWIPKMILQPLVENTVIHGLAEKKEGGEIRISAEEITMNEKHCIRISIFDNGAGIPPEVVEKYNQLFLQSADENEDKIYPSSIGIQNVHKKIMLLYGQPFGLHMESVLGAYTRVDILLPLVDKAPETLEF